MSQNLIVGALKIHVGRVREYYFKAFQYLREGNAINKEVMEL